MGGLTVKNTSLARLERDLAAVCAEVQRCYPDLMLVSGDGKPVLRGTFPVMLGDRAIDRFAIQIEFPDGVGKPPAIKEIGGRIPHTADRHVFAGGYICAEVPELTLLRGSYTLLNYLGGPVHNYFLGQLAVEGGDPWPFGERPHGAKGLIEAYGELLGVTAEPSIRRFLDCLGHAKIKGHWPCPCGSGARLRDCHKDLIRDLQQRIPAKIARSASNSLKLYSRN